MGEPAEHFRECFEKYEATQETGHVINLFNTVGNVDIQDPKGKTFLMLAASKGDKPFVKRLLQKNAAVNVRDNDKRSALFYAIQRGHYDTAKYLLDNGAAVSVTKCDKHSDSPLHLACQYERCDFAEMLLQHGASVNIHNTQGETPASLAYKSGNRKLVTLLESKSEHNHTTAMSLSYVNVTQQQYTTSKNQYEEVEDWHCALWEGKQKGSTPSVGNDPEGQGETNGYTFQVPVPFSSGSLVKQPRGQESSHVSKSDLTKHSLFQQKKDQHHQNSSDSEEDYELPTQLEKREQRQTDPFYVNKHQRTSDDTGSTCCVFLEKNPLDKTKTKPVPAPRKTRLKPEVQPKLWINKNTAAGLDSRESNKVEGNRKYPKEGDFQSEQNPDTGQTDGCHIANKISQLGFAAVKHIPKSDQKKKVPPPTPPKPKATH